MIHLYKRSMFILLCAMCISTAQAHNTADKKVRLTIFVHGIMSIKPHLSFSNFMRFITDRVEDTLYSDTVRYMREDDFFFKNQAMQEIGFHKIDPDKIEKGYVSGLIARQFNMVEKSTDPYHTYENHYYNYGWYGLLSTRLRYFDSLPLYEGIVAEVAKFRAQGIEPEIRLIGYSHGGNVCLNLGAVRQNEPVDQTLRIDELILLGVPIQCETDFLLTDPIFKRVYQIYSRGDRIQKLDFFSTKRFFSRRMFTSRSYFQLPKKLTQIQVRITRAVKGKKRTCLPCFNPNDVPSVSGKSDRFRDASPGHIELWFYGWTPENYRKNFILDPLPFMIFIPLVLDQVEDTIDRAQTPKPDKPIIFDVRPEYEQIIIKNQKSWANVTVMEFLDKKTLQELKDMVKPYIPDCYTVETYNEHIAQALKTASDEKAKTCQGKIKRRRCRPNVREKKPCCRIRKRDRLCKPLH